VNKQLKKKLILQNKHGKDLFADIFLAVLLDGMAIFIFVCVRLRVSEVD